jgi:hypothetical protein
LPAACAEQHERGKRTGNADQLFHFSPPIIGFMQADAQADSRRGLR